MAYEIRNPRLTAGGLIDCEINHPVYGWIPFTASATDADAQSRAVFAVASGMSPAPYVPPAPSVPQKVTRRQARQALLLAGKLGLVQPAIDAIADPVQRQMVQIEWDDSQDFERSRPSLVALASQIGLSSQELDALFVQAAQLP